MNRFFLAVVFLLVGCTQDQSVALGTLERERVAHTATAAEVIVDLPIAEGTLVQEGDVLVQLDTTLQQANLASAKAKLAETYAQLIKAQNGARAEDIAAAKAQVNEVDAALTASTTRLARENALFKKGLSTSQTLDSAKADHDALKAKLVSAQEALRRLTNGTRIEDLQMAEAAVQAAEALVVAEEKRLADLTIKATRNGVLDSLPWHLGERVAQGSVLAVLLAGEAPYARVYIPATHRAALNVGDALTIRINGIATPITGTLRWVSYEPAYTPYYALSENERDHLSYLAKVQLPADCEPKSCAALPSGLAVEVDLTPRQ